MDSDSVSLIDVGETALREKISAIATCGSRGIPTQRPFCDSRQDRSNLRSRKCVRAADDPVWSEWAVSLVPGPENLRILLWGDKVKNRHGYSGESPRSRDS